MAGPFGALFLAANIIGTTATVGSRLALAGGTAISGAGRALGAAASLASTATRVAGGTIGAATGLVKGVSSAVGVDSEPADQSTSDDQGAKALPPGVKLNKNGVMVQDRGAKGGGQVLPGQFDDDGMLMSLDDRLGSMEAPDRGDAGPVQQILDYVKVIAANTARTSAGVGMMASSMSFGSSQSNIDDEKPPEQGGGGGVLSKAFGAVGKTLKSVGTSLGKTLKFMVKGLAIGGALYLFISKQDEIKEAVAGIFKYFHELYLTIKESDDPIGEIFAEIKKQFKKLGDSMLVMFKDFYKETIEPMIDGMFNFLRVKIEDFVSTILGTNQTKKREVAKIKMTTSGDALDSLVQENISLGGTGDLGVLSGFDFGFGMDKQYTRGGDDENKAMRDRITAAAKKRFTALAEYSRASDYSVQWKGLPFFEAAAYSGNWDILNSAESEMTAESAMGISAIMNTKPIINGITMPMSFLDNLDLDEFLGIDRTTMADTDIEGIRSNAAEASTIRWMQENTVPGINAFGQKTMVEKFRSPSFLTDGVGLFKDSPEEADEKIKILQKASFETFGALLPDAEMQDKIAAAMLHDSGANGNNSIFTHDNNTHRLLEPISKAFENGNGNGAVIMDNSSNSSSVVKQGDTIQMPLGIHTTDPTAHAFHEWKYA